MIEKGKSLPLSVTMTHETNKCLTDISTDEDTKTHPDVFRANNEEARETCS